MLLPWDKTVHYMEEAPPKSQKTRRKKSRKSPQKFKKKNNEQRPCGGPAPLKSQKIVILRSALQLHGPDFKSNFKFTQFPFLCFASSFFHIYCETNSFFFYFFFCLFGQQQQQHSCSDKIRQLCPWHVYVILLFSFLSNRSLASHRLG